MKALCYLSLIGLYIFSSSNLQATHLMGGEISWRCDTSGAYIFQVTLFRDCSGAPIPPQGNLKIHNYPSSGQISSYNLTIQSSQELKPICDPSSSFSGYSCARADPEANTVFQLLSNPLTLNGNPPANGWIITYDDNARNFNDNLSGTPGITLRAKMFNYPARPAGSCLDQAPRFINPPVTVTKTGENFYYNPHGSDPDLDSLSFEWAQPLNRINSSVFVQGSNPSPIAFRTGYSYQNPFPGTNQNAQNIPASLDPINGIIFMRNYDQGKYVAVVKASSFKCGLKTAEIYREYQFYFVNTPGVNNQPSFGGQQMNLDSIIRDTVVVGATYTRPIQVFDPPTLSGSGPIIDSVWLMAYSQQFGDNFTSSTTGCLIPPCATLSKSLPDKQFFGNNAMFNWQTTAAHLQLRDSCHALSADYTFVFAAADDFCPIPSRSEMTLQITVLDSSLLGPITTLKEEPKSANISVYPNPNNGKVFIEGSQSTVYNYQLFDLQGKLLDHGRLDPSQRQLELPAKAGVYFLKLMDANGNAGHYKVVRN